MRFEKIKVHWATENKETAGNAYGYSTHNAMMRKHCEKYFEFCNDAEISISIAPADFFKQVDGKYNILFTMFEFKDLPNSYLQRLDRADAIVVPCRFCRDVFKRHTSKPVEVCPEGIDPNVYQYYSRKKPLFGDKFRFLWVGAPNPRKGYPLILEAVKIFENVKDVEVYIKTTTDNTSREDYVKRLWYNRRKIRSEKGHEYFKELLSHTKESDMANKVQRHGKYENIVVDTRKLDLADLLELYASSHCFVLPTFGEGWGLTLTEAMATGAPCIATPVTGCADYFDDSVGYPISYSMIEQELLNYDVISEGYLPDTQSMFKQMLNVIGNYDQALAKGKRASDRIRTKYTWDNAAKRLYDIVIKLTKKEVCLL